MIRPGGGNTIDGDPCAEKKPRPKPTINTTAQAQIKQAHAHILKKPLQDYFEDRIDDKITRKYEHLRKQHVHYAVSYELSNGRQSISCLEAQLVKAREGWSKARMEMDERWETASQKNHDLLHQIPTYNVFYKDLLGKRDATLRIWKDEVVQLKVKNRENRAKVKQIRKLEELLEKSKERCEKFNSLNKYLQHNVESHPEQYSDINDFINRYNNDKSIDAKLKTASARFCAALLVRQKSLKESILMKSQNITAYTNYLVELYNYGQEILSTIVHLEDDYAMMKETSDERTLVLGKIKNTILNLYQEICKTMHRHEEINSDDTIGQLLDIRVSVREIVHLTREVKRMQKVANLQAAAEAETRAKQEKAADDKKKRMEKFLNVNNEDLMQMLLIPEKKHEMDGLINFLLPTKASDLNRHANSVIMHIGHSLSFGSISSSTMNVRDSKYSVFSTRE